MKITLDFVRSHATIDGDGPEVLSLFQAIREVLPQLTEIKIVTGSADRQNGGADDDNRGDDQQNQRRTGKMSMREFARALRVTSLSERIAAIAAYVERVEGKGFFSPKEMSDWFTICGFEKPSQMGVALFDAKRKNGTLEKGGHGVWKLSTAGENLVTRKMEESGVSL